MSATPREIKNNEISPQETYKAQNSIFKTSVGLHYITKGIYEIQGAPKNKRYIFKNNKQFVDELT